VRRRPRPGRAVGRAGAPGARSAPPRCPPAPSPGPAPGWSTSGYASAGRGSRPRRCEPGTRRRAPWSGVEASGIQIVLQTQEPQASGRAARSACRGRAPPAGSAERALRLDSFRPGPSTCRTFEDPGVGDHRPGDVALVRQVRQAAAARFLPELRAGRVAAPGRTARPPAGAAAPATYPVGGPQDEIAVPVEPTAGPRPARHQPGQGPVERRPPLAPGVTLPAGALGLIRGLSRSQRR
jgi:hypothetical protein